MTYEYDALRNMAAGHSDLTLAVTGTDFDGIPTSYSVEYRIKSICGIDEEKRPLFADRFTMEIVIPEGYPQVDAPPRFQFVGDVLPWHPNIRYHGDMAGHVCINQLNTFTDIAWGVERVALYLRYELYHAIQEPPFPEDLRVAEWVRHVGEPLNYIFFDQ